MSNIIHPHSLKIILLVHLLALGAFVANAQTSLIPLGSSWKYLDNGSNQGTAWRTLSFNDGSWKTGNGKFGYGISDATTSVSYGTNAKKKYVTTYFRKSISIADVTAYASYTAKVKRDDGVVVYVNGVEVYRNNMPTGSISYTTLANEASDNGSSAQSFTIRASAFTTGTNIIATEIHQAKANTPDMAFDLELVGNLALPPPTDQTPPTVVSINRQSPTSETTSSTSLIFRNTFSEQVKGVDATDFTTTTVSGTTSGAITSVSSVGTTGTTYDVSVGSVSGEGILRLDLINSGTGIVDAAGNAISGGYSSGQSYTITQPSPPSSLPLNFKSAWKYLDNGSNQGTAWRTASFDDSSWKVGNGKFGYGISDAATVVSYGSNSSNKYITTYFRKSISIPDASAFTSYAAKVNRDDGVVVYINGAEVYRNNMPTGTISYTTLASGTSGGDDGATPIPFTIPASAFSSGTNVIAVEIHQASVTSSDIAFDMEVVGNTGVLTPVLTRGPYLQMGNKSAVTIRWRTDIPTDSKVEVGTTSGSYTQAVTDPAATTEHEVRLTGLTPNTKYFYRIGTSSQTLQGESSNYFNTAPPDNTTGKIRIAVFGDCGRDDNGNRTNTLNSYLNYTSSNPAEILLLLGDNAYPDGTEADYQREFFTPFKNNILKNHVLFPAPGNHEYDSIPLTTRNTGGYYRSFSVPTAGECGGVASGSKAFYSFDWGNIHFVSMDSYGVEALDNTKLYDTLGVQVRWLKKDLEANTKKWTIVYWHHPPHTKGSHNSDTEGELIRLRQNFIRILERYGVDLVLTGHSHNYERSYLLNNYYGNEDSFSMATHTKSSSSAKYDGTTNSCPYVTSYGAKNHGTVYTVAGSSGASGSVQAGYPHNALPFAVNDGGMLYLEVEDNRLDARMLRKDGTVFDKFTIMQDVNKTTDVTTTPGEPVQLTASWVGTYKWSTGATTRSITVTSDSSTTYHVTDVNNCIADVFKVNTNVLSITQSTEQLLNSQINLIEVYPTLVARGAAVTVSTKAPEIREVYVSDATGRLIYTSKFTGTTSIETANLPSGLYIISLHGKDQLKKYKFIVTD